MITGIDYMICSAACDSLHFTTLVFSRSYFRPDVHSVQRETESYPPPLFSSTNLFPAYTAPALLSDALSVTMYGESARVTWSPVTSPSPPPSPPGAPGTVTVATVTC